MELNQNIQSLIDQGDWFGLAGYYWDLLGPYQLYVVVGAIGFILLLVLAMWIGSLGTGARVEGEPVPVSTKGHKPKGAAFIPMVVGDVVVDLQPRRNETIHVAVGGTSRLGKSTTVLPLLDLDLGVLIIAMDNTRPIMERIRELPDGIEWTNEPDWPIGIDLLRGEPRIVSEVLVEGWASRSAQDTGKWRRLARSRLWTALDEMDALGLERNIFDLSKVLWKKTGDNEIDRACRDWASRLQELNRTMGSSLGKDLDVTQAMRNKKKVLLRVNPYLNPLDAPMLSGMLLVHARRASQDAGVPFVIVIEEAGQMSIYQEEIVPLAQASADRGVPLVVITQNLTKLPLEVANNISTWISFAQEDKREQTFAAHKLRLEPSQLQREAFPGKREQQGRGWCYVRAPGVTTRLVNVKLPKPIRKDQLMPTILRGPGWQVADADHMINNWKPWTPALPPPHSEVPRDIPRDIPHIEIPVESKNPPKSARMHMDERPWWVGQDPDMLRFWAQMKRTGLPTPLWSPERGVWWVEDGCLEWHGPLSKPKEDKKLGRPRSNIGKASVTVYKETAKAAGKEVEPSWDHNCDQPVCVDPDHGQARTITENNNIKNIRTVKLEAAWIERCGAIPEWWARRHYERSAD